MTIDPIAALTTLTSGAGSSAAGADPAASVNAASSQQDGTGSRAADQSAKVDLFDYTSQHQNRPPAIDTLAPESKAKYLSNPAALGEKVLQGMEGLHQRSLDYHNRFQVEMSSPTTSPATGEGVMAGPAASDVAGSAKPTSANPFSGLKVMFDYAVETTMVSNSSSQFVSSVNTLMRGQ